MSDLLNSLLPGVPSPSTLIVMGVGLGVMLAVFGVATTVTGKDPVLRRIEAQRRSGAGLADKDLLRHVSKDPKGLLAALIPRNRDERMDVERKLAIAGFTGPHAVRNYYLLRVGLGVVLPLLALLLVFGWRTGAVQLPAAADTALAGMTDLRMIQILCLFVSAGFFGPAVWLGRKAAARRREIEESFPNALDLVQISVEAGLGLDAAMVRVGNELAEAAPALAAEFLQAQREIQAGRPRDRALLDMGGRTGVEEVTSFASVVLQSIQLGTSISETLTTYATEMRRSRELRAQEKANRLPVQMSAALASLMLPALLMLTLGPVFIRYTHYLAGQ